MLLVFLTHKDLPNCLPLEIWRDAWDRPHSSPRDLGGGLPERPEYTHCTVHIFNLVLYISVRALGAGIMNMQFSKSLTRWLAHVPGRNVQLLYSAPKYQSSSCIYFFTLTWWLNIILICTINVEFIIRRARALELEVIDKSASLSEGVETRKSQEASLLTTHTSARVIIILNSQTTGLNNRSNNGCVHKWH